MTSADGTPIALHTVGDGPAVVIVNGALSTARDAGLIARAFADAGLRAVTYERRARGDSGDAPIAAPEREVEDLAAVIAASGDAVVLFQREAVGLPEAFIEQFRNSPAFEQVAALARSTVYDTLLTQRTSTPSAAMRDVRMPVTILRGSETMPILVAAASRLAEEMPAAEFLEVPESVAHRMDPEATARIVAARVR